MRYRFEYCPNPAWVVLHLTERITERAFVSVSACGRISGEENEILSILGSASGVRSVSITPYLISAEIGAAFSREEVCKALIERVKMLAPERGWDDSEWVQLPTMRSDIDAIQCPACMARQKEKMLEGG